MTESLILFTTTRCPNCPPVKAELDNLGLDYTTVVANQSEENMALAQEWLVAAVPTLLVLKNVGGNDVLEARYIGDKIIPYARDLQRDLLQESSSGGESGSCAVLCDISKQENQ
jgi:glutaredoxin